MQGTAGGQASTARRALSVLCCWGLFALAVAGTWSLVTPGEARGQEDPDTAVDGAHLWARDCASCHGVDGEGTDTGPSLEDKGAAGVKLSLTSGRMPLPDDTVIDDPEQVRVPRGPVRYTPDEITALVDHARTLVGDPEVPDVDVGAGDVARGEEVYKINCAACHTWSGRGGALTNGRIAPTLAEATPEEVVAAMRTGLGTMPQFSEKAISDAEATDVAAYVDELRNPPSPGGAGLAYLGPFAEGFVAWTVGIVLLLLVVRWIGRSRA